MLRCFKVALISALIAPLGLSAAAQDIATWHSSFGWPTSAHGAGGFSGLEVSADGQSFVTISDSSHVIFGQFERRDGALEKVVITQSSFLHDTKGRPMRGQLLDAEGLAMVDSGPFYVSFEANHRVRAFKDGSKAQEMPNSQAFTSLQNNSGLEALAIDAKGRLLAIPERSGRLDRPFPVYRLERGTWRKAYDLPRLGGFLVVGADVGPDGRLYVLEREFTGFAFRSRVRRFDITETSATNETTLFTSPPLLHGNLEGIAVWRDGQGDMRLTMIADNNFKSFQRTEFVEYSVKSQ